MADLLNNLGNLILGNSATSNTSGSATSGLQSTAQNATTQASNLGGLSGDVFTPTSTLTATNNTVESTALASDYNINQAVSSIGGSDINRALNLPTNLNLGPVDATGFVPSLGDFTGVTIQLIPIVISHIYQKLQQVLSAKSFLETAPYGVTPNPDFAYIQGRPPYGQDTPEGQKLQEEVFMKLRANIISLLARIAQQLQLAEEGLQSQASLAKSFKSFQDQQVTQSIQSGGSSA